MGHNRVANPAHSLYVIKPYTSKGSRQRWKGGMRRIRGRHDVYCRLRQWCAPPFLSEGEGGGGCGVASRATHNPPGRAVTSNHPPEIWQRPSTDDEGDVDRRSTPKSRLNVHPHSPPPRPPPTLAATLYTSSVAICYVFFGKFVDTTSDCLEERRLREDRLLEFSHGEFSSSLCAI